MKKMMVLFLWVTYVSCSGTGWAQNMIDLGRCELKVVQVREIESFQGEQGEKVKPSRRDARFMELKLEGMAYVDGVSAWYPQMFSALFIYRGMLRVTPAVALGIKWNDPISGEQERWFHKAGVSYNMGCNQSESMRAYVIVEIAREADSFQVQGPGFLPQVSVEPGAVSMEGHQ
ncbi:hypothetical protein JXQ70_07320 [bacterium]|nr:hypothetical protein [bacterium]